MELYPFWFLEQDIYLRNSIKEVIKHSHQKIEIKLTVPAVEPDPIIISKKEINNFKNWLDQ